MSKGIQTWTFREDEGGTTVISYNDQEATVSRSSGPDCDGTQTYEDWAFLPASEGPAEFPEGTWHRVPRSNMEYNVYVSDPDAAAFDFVRDQLGWALITGRYPLTAPEF